MRLFRALGAMATLPAALAPPSAAQAPVPRALTVLERGAWEITPRARGALPLNICIGDPHQLLQLYHLDNRCTYQILDNRATGTVVHYSCPGAGYGRTMLRVETSRLVQIHTQGILRGAPFETAYEARHKGECR